MSYPKNITPETRFWAKVRKSDGCWSWLATTDNDGYGKIKVSSKDGLAHRFSWQLHFGPIPKGMRVLHTCDNPPCTNPKHLFLGTNQDNTRDAIAKGRLRFDHEGSFSSGVKVKFARSKRNPKPKHGAVSPVITALRIAAACLSAKDIKVRCPQLTLAQVYHSLQILRLDGSIVRHNKCNLYTYSL